MPGQPGRTGYYDPSTGESLEYRVGDGERFRVPTDTEIKTVLEKTGYEAVTIGESQTVTIDKSDMVLDLGAVGKGFALDIAEQILKEDAVSGGTISVGGSVLVYGAKKDGSSFRVGIRDPQGDAEDMIGYLEFASNSNTCVSTSGDYEKFIEKDGTRYHHILNRTTGYPAESGLASVTVVCKMACTAMHCRRHAMCLAMRSLCRCCRSTRQRQYLLTKKIR